LSSAVYSGLVDTKIVDKACRITWVGIDEKATEEATRAYDREAIKEVVETSGDKCLLEEFNHGRIEFCRHPRTRVPGRLQSSRPRIIKVSLRNQELRDRLLQHMRSGRQSLTKDFVHSYARPDYTREEIEYDRALRRKAGIMNSQEGKLTYIVRDLAIHKLRASYLQTTLAIANLLSLSLCLRFQSHKLMVLQKLLTRKQGEVMRAAHQVHTFEIIAARLFNARSLVNKIADLNFLLHEKPHGLFITESWCKPWSIQDAVLSHRSNYHVYRCDREDTESQKVLTLLTYRSPSCSTSSFTDFVEYIECFLSEWRDPVVILEDFNFPTIDWHKMAHRGNYIECFLSEWRDHVVILGDFNFPTIDWHNMAHRGNVSTQASSSFLHLARSFNLTQMVKEPTHGMNILDILLTSEPSIIAGLCTLPPFSTSDHRRVKFKIVDAS
ncbi:hypothetical protein COOONC_12860, partial [Cooperia oncophora]